MEAAQNGIFFARLPHKALQTGISEKKLHYLWIFQTVISNFNDYKTKYCYAKKSEVIAMRHFFVLFTALTPLLIATPVAAQAQETQSSDGEPLTRIEADSESHEIHFYIDGAPAAILNADGLHVRNDINFGGTVRDYGREGFDKIAPNPDALSMPRDEDVDAE